MQVQNCSKYISAQSDGFKKKWCHLLQKCEDFINTSVHKTTKVIPLELATGFMWRRDPVTEAPVRMDAYNAHRYAALYHQANASRAQYSCKIMESYSDPRGEKLERMKLGDTVLARFVVFAHSDVSWSVPVRKLGKFKMPWLVRCGNKALCCKAKVKGGSLHFCLTTQSFIFMHQISQGILNQTSV